jgi:hypothetical protein
LYRLNTSAIFVLVNGVTYYQVGSTGYQPQYQGSQVTYVVVNPPQQGATVVKSHSSTSPLTRRSLS